MTMTRMIHHVARLGVLAGVLAGVAGLLLQGCSADPRPLEEAVEASNLDLAQLFIESDEITGANVTVNPGETIQLSVRGLDTAGQEVSFSNTDRRWYVTDPAVASITGSGFLTALANGAVSIGMRLGGIVASPMTITVSDAQLTAISNIEGPDSLTECKSSDPYTAQGAYDDGSIRELRNLEWSLAAGSNGKLLDSSLTQAVVGGLAPGLVTLQATSEGIAGFRELTVDAGLSALSILPAVDEIEVEQNANLLLTAQAEYNDEVSGDELTATVTSLVTWSIDETVSVATISNAEGEEGVLRGVNLGRTDVTATCGNQAVSSRVRVVIPERIVSLIITPEEDPLILRLNGGSKQLTVIALSAQDARDDVTDEATYIVRSGTDNIIVDGSGQDRGEISPVAVGRAVVEITYREGTDSINVTVIN